MICWQALYKRPKRLHYDFLPDFIVRLQTIIIVPFPASWLQCCRLSFLFFLCSVLKPRFNVRNMGTRSDQYKKWFKSICMTNLLRRHLFELVTWLACYADVLRVRHAFLAQVVENEIFESRWSIILEVLFMFKLYYMKKHMYGMTINIIIVAF